MHGPFALHQLQYLRQKRRFAIVAGFLLAGFVGLLCLHRGTVLFPWKRAQLFSRAELARTLGQQSGHPAEIEVMVAGRPEKATVAYTFDNDLQAEIEDLFKQYVPDYGAFVALDPATGRVLALVSQERQGRTSRLHESLQENLALRATFPSASVFKVVTAAAAIAEQKFTADTRIAFNGANHTLYRSNVLKNTSNRWTRTISLRDAFANSINTVFARIGAFSLGAEKLGDYARRFGFNREIASDLPVQSGHAAIEEDSDSWQLAEAASGFTRETTMSPLQGALIAATLVNEGKMVSPYAVESVQLRDGEKVYSASIGVPEQAVQPAVAEEVLDLMRQTVISGTSRKSFRGFSRRTGSMVDVGGKTGSLTGLNPRGKYDWFVGFGKRGQRSIALAALTIHKDQWRVKSSYLARRAIERYLLGF